MATSPAIAGSTSSTADDGKYVVSNPQKLLGRHFSTIGIDDVFLSPPSHPLLSTYMNQGCSGDSFLSWEFVGTIKTNPEDFVVREVFPANKSIPGLTHGDMSLLQVADILNEKTMPTQHLPQQQDFSQLSKKEDVTEGNNPLDNSETTHSKPSETSAGNVRMEATETEPSTPLEAITLFLKKALCTHVDSPVEITVEGVLSSLKDLHSKALARIEHIASAKKNETTQNPTDVWIPSICSNSDASATTDKLQRGAFHRAFKVEFPLLMAQSAQWNQQQGAQAEDGGGGGTRPASKWMKASVDERYNELIPFLLYPAKELLALVTFEKRGFDATPESKEVSSTRQRKGHDGSKYDRNMDDSRTKVLLTLKPGLAKEDRRTVHRIISSRCKFFGTTTINDVPLANDAEKAESFEMATNNQEYPAEQTASNKTTVTVAVSWQKHMFKSNKKRKRGSDKNSANNPNDDKFSNLLCVLRKRRKEHLTALQKVSRCIRCRQSDIGIAGIKDMHAVTYQFVTIRNMKASRAKHANKQLRQQGIELGNLLQVDWVLSNGDLEGNQFEILIRDVHRVSVQCKDEQQPSTETLVPCELQHVKEMTERIKAHGFVNFYGEQRLGTPGDMAEVGVRSFDIGRAMLQGRYADAIDLLMTGRLICRGENERESRDMIRIRQTWKDSNGDPAETLKAFRGKEILSREKIVLKGLQRYGRDQPLEALRCLSHSVRIFWINAYQSLVWNTVASERIKKYGSKVLKGDLYVDGIDNTRQDVKVVGSDDDSTVQLSQIVLPLPGHDVQYPANELGDCYERILEKDGVKFEKGGAVESTAKGSYRRVVVFPSSLEVRQDADATLNLNFQLPKGCYATMLLRELMLTTATR